MHNLPITIESNKYHELVMELQRARKCGAISLLQFRENDIHVYFVSSTNDDKLLSVVQHIKTRYKLYVEFDAPRKKIVICDASTLIYD